MAKLPLPTDWDLYKDKLGQGYKVEYPIKVKPIINYTATTTIHSIPVEKLKVDFCKSPYSD